MMIGFVNVQSLIRSSQTPQRGVDRRSKQSGQMIQNLNPFRRRIQGSENIGPNDVEFDPFVDQEVTCKLKTTQMTQNFTPWAFKFSASDSGSRDSSIGPNDVKFGPLLGQKAVRKFDIRSAFVLLPRKFDRGKATPKLQSKRRRASTPMATVVF
jgi:hypothetical protein